MHGTLHNGKVKLDLSNVTINTKSGDFNPTSLAHVVNTDTINHVVLHYLPYPFLCGSGNGITYGSTISDAFVVC